MSEQLIDMPHTNKRTKNSEDVPIEITQTEMYTKMHAHTHTHQTGKCWEYDIGGLQQTVW